MEMEMEMEMEKMKTETWFKSKNGSVFPKKRRLVKRMIFDLLLQSLTSCFSSSSGAAHQPSCLRCVKSSARVSNFSPTFKSSY
uniref:Uncharacterized protein n=1 Tax=Manihot esculenta TaxID=3983 RepID=A0A199U9D8_MANES